MRRAKVVQEVVTGLHVAQRDSGVRVTHESAGPVQWERLSRHRFVPGLCRTMWGVMVPLGYPDPAPQRS